MPVGESVYTEIGAFEAKTKLSEILRKVDQGERFTITVRGRAVANLVPMQAAAPVHTPKEIEAAYQRLKHPRITGISAREIRAAIEEGRP
jgi:prevent-host-death family protein